MENHPVASLLADVPLPLPLYLSRFEAEVTFTPSYSGQEDRQVVDDAFGELNALVKAGFFAWAYMDKCAGAHLSVDWRDKGFTVRGVGAGLHHNLLVCVLRMIVSLHHTPLQARQELIAALGDDAGALPPRSIWFELIGHMRLRGLEGADDRVTNRRDFDGFMADDQIVRPRSEIENLSAEWDGARLIVRAQDGSQLLDKSGLAAIAGDFLGVCNTGGFRSLSRLDEMPEEAAMFIRPGDRGRELVIDDYRDQPYGLVELLSAMTKGRNAMLFVSEGE